MDLRASSRPENPPAISIDGAAWVVGLPITMLLLAVAASWAAPAAAQSAPPNPNIITARNVPPQYGEAVAFLEFLKPARESTGFDAKAAPQWEAAKLTAFLSGKGVAFTDVNRPRKVEKLSAKQVADEAEKRRGRAFTALAHLGYIFAQPYKHYSELSFAAQSDGGVVVRVAEWYRLTFATEAGALKLAGVDYLQPER